MVIADKDISFVVQGPVQAGSKRSQIEGITKRSLESIRRYFPESTIILSTWKGQDISGLSYDRLLQLVDPGPNLIMIHNKEKVLNSNRQLFSSNQGLQHVTTKYAVKMRSDQLLTGRGFIDVYQKYVNLPREEFSMLFKQRTITTSAYTLASHLGKPIYFHKNDFFDFGLTEDLLKIWPEPMLDTLHFFPRNEYKAREPATEQYLVLHWLGLLLNQKLAINNKTLDDAGLGEEYWQKFLANNIIIAKPDVLNIDLTKRFEQRGNEALEYDLDDWLYFNKIAKKPLDMKRIYRAYKEFIGRCIRILHVFN